MVEPPADKTLVYWGTPKVEEALEVSEWPRVYRERNAIQELSFKSMIDHGGLDINPYPASVCITSFPKPSRTVSHGVDSIALGRCQDPRPPSPG